MRHVHSLESRFWPKVNKNGPVPEYLPDLGPCWLWVGSIHKSGYGHIWEGPITKKVVYAHVVSYELCVGIVPSGKQLDHLCRNRWCVNWAHLEVVTGQVNVLRSPYAPTAINARKTTCPRGHPYDLFKYHWRGCSICKVANRQKWEEKHPHYHKELEERKKLQSVTS